MPAYVWLALRSYGVFDGVTLFLHSCALISRQDGIKDGQGNINTARYCGQYKQRYGTRTRMGAPSHSQGQGTTLPALVAGRWQMARCCHPPCRRARIPFSDVIAGGDGENLAHAPHSPTPARSQTSGGPVRFTPCAGDAKADYCRCLCAVVGVVLGTKP